MKQANKIITFARIAIYLIALAGLSLWGWKQWQMAQSKKETAESSANAQSEENYILNQSEHIVLVTYFTSDQRCATCKTIEQLTQEAVSEGFAEQLSAKEVIFQTINFDRPENAHHIDHYQLAFKTVVVSERKKGKEVKWNKYDRVWDLVDQPKAFKSYLQSGIRQYLENPKQPNPTPDA
ncbi:hypothetical protein HW115_03940 [Verrucomicrobiaceae bacterium N1E253]|uniref:Thioredoxin domain-containing protein n=1 Tax=Oceaniferula marina TaxID=2748318 RepID=A0A851GBE9_9BACT|nr:nitrophenyl compound nitroreductase subunit ArsF family protein [Oceaniferula marina]NWK54746.1 hypothetical protein [Oceaniferula marina]